MNGVGKEKTCLHSSCFCGRGGCWFGTTSLAANDTISSGWLFEMTLITLSENVIFHVPVSSSLLTGNPLWAFTFVPSALHIRVTERNKGLAK